VDEAAREHVAREHGVPVFAEVGRALEVPGVHAAALATPSGLHPGHIEAAAARGVHVLCEKPLALDLESARGALARAAQAGVLVQTVRPLRSWPSLEWVARMLADGVLGVPRLLDARVLWARPQRYYDEAPWRKDPALDGGVLWNQAYHYADLITWWLGRPDEVFARESTLGLDVGVPDTASVEMTYPSAHVSLRASVLAPNLNLDGSLALVCEHGSVLLGGVACERVVRAVVRGEPLPADELAALDARNDALRARGHRPVYDAFAAALSDPTLAEPQPLETLEWLDAARRSARERAPVRLPFMTAETTAEEA
jgi:UDP-N-acetyl-2-amino-2-deoxyglucuronate dehydrogenase